jgi:TolA-binding protein
MATDVDLVNKSEYDAQIAEILDRLDSMGAPADNSGGVTQNQLDESIATALENAHADAQSLASGAITTADAYTDTKSAAAVATAGTNAAAAVAAHNTSPTAHGLDIPNLATKAYVDAVASGFDPGRFKQPAKALATTNVTKSGEQTIDGVALVARVI